MREPMLNCSNGVEMDSELRIEQNIRLLLLLLLLCLHGCGLFHSAYGVRQDKMNDAYDTPARKAVPMSIHTSTSTDKGDRNENKLGGCFCGFLYKMLIPIKPILQQTIVIVLLKINYHFIRVQ